MRRLSCLRLNTMKALNAFVFHFNRYAGRKALHCRKYTETRGISSLISCNFILFQTIKKPMNTIKWQIIGVDLMLQTCLMTIREQKKKKQVNIIFFCMIIGHFTFPVGCISSCDT